MCFLPNPFCPKIRSKVLGEFCSWIEIPMDEVMCLLKLWWVGRLHPWRHHYYVYKQLMLENGFMHIHRNLWAPKGKCIQYLNKVDNVESWVRSIYLWRKGESMFVCFVCHIEISQTMVPLVTTLVPLESRQWVGAMELVFIMFWLVVKKLLQI